MSIVAIWFKFIALEEEYFKGIFSAILRSAELGLVKTIPTI